MVGSEVGKIVGIEVGIIVGIEVGVGVCFFMIRSLLNERRAP